MARLFISAMGDDGRAAPGNKENAVIIVIVEGAAGGGITGLDLANFKVSTSYAEPGGSMCKISNVQESLQKGVYALYVVPFEGNKWTTGVYIFSIAVTHGRDKGLALCRFVVD